MKNLFAVLTTAHAVVYIIIIGLLVYANSFLNGLVGDDVSLTIDNPYIHSIANIKTFFSGSLYYNGATQYLGGNFYRPLFLSFLSTIYTIFGPNPFAFHFFQVVLHIANSSILFILLCHFFKKPLAFVLSLIFLVHPINSESVLHVAAVQDTLYFFFGALSMWILINVKSIKGLVFVAITLCASLFTKETGILFVCASCVYAFFYKRNYFSALVCYALMILGAYFLLRVNAVGLLKASGARIPIIESTLGVRLLNIPAIITFYLIAFIFPMNLAMSYHWVITQIDLYNFILPLIVVSLFVTVILWFGLRLHKKYPSNYVTIYLFFYIWFSLGMLLHIQIYALDQTVAERWFYFPMVGILGMIGVVCEVSRINMIEKRVFIPVALIILLLSIRTYIRTYDWRNGYTLASHDIIVSPEAYPLERMLSVYYYNKGEYNKMREHAFNSIKLYPTAGGYLNLGVAYFHLGNFNLAKKAYTTSLEYGDYYKAYENLAFLQLEYGDPEENIHFIRNVSLKKFPQDANLWLCLAALEYNFGSKRNAKTYIQKAYQYDQSEKIASVYHAIMRDKQVKIGLKKR